MSNQFNLPPLKRPFKGLSLNPAHQKKLKSIVRKEVRTIKNHFKQGAWNLNAELILSTILQDLTGVDMLYSVMSEVINKVPGLHGTAIDGDFVFVNTKDKVFYNGIRNKVYVAHSAKDVNNDINLGDL